MLTIGIAGGSGSGKSTIVERLLALDFGPRIAHLPHDAYYRNRIDMPEIVAANNNWDHPDALDTSLFLRHVDILKSGLPIAAPVYDFGTHSRSSAVKMVPAQPILLLEGILLFSIPELRDRIDLKVYVDTPSDLRIVRRMTRDVIERKRTVESVVDQYQSTVRPMHAIFVEPSRQFADIIIPWEHHNHQAIDLLAAKIRQSLQ
jgi:uridine kinase